MRVLLVSHAFPPDGLGGVERYTEGLAGALAAAGDTVSIAARAPDGSGSGLEREHVDGVLLYRLRCPKIEPDRFLAGARALERMFETVLAETAPEVVHVNHLLRLSTRFVDAAHRHGAAVVLSLWDYYFVCARHQLMKTSGRPCDGPDGGRECARTCFSGEGPEALPRWRARTAYFELLLGTVERVLCPSRSVASYFAPYLACSDRVRELPLGLPGPLPTNDGGLRSRPRDSQSLHLAVLGQVYPNKGAHAVLDALDLAALPAVRLSIVGKVIDRGYADRLEQRAAEIPGVKLAVTGPYAPLELPQLLRDVDIVLVPSQCRETFAFVAREALALGVPVLAARMGALPEAIAEGENGFTFAHDEPAELAELLRRLGADEALLSRLRAGTGRRPPLPIAVHAQAIRTVYAEAMAEFANGGTTTAADHAQLERLERRLVDLGFDRR